MIQESLATVVCALVIILAIYLLKKTQRYPYIRFSSLLILKDDIEKTPEFAGRKFYVFGLILFALAWADFHLENPWQDKYALQKPPATEGIALYFALDCSGSMKDNVDVSLDGEEKKPIRKIDLLKIITKKFILGDLSNNENSLEGDMIGLVTFARTATVVSPLTLDYASIIKKLEKIKAVTNPQEDGTAIGYAVYKITDLIAATKEFGKQLFEGKQVGYEIKGAAIILVTDGFQTINPADTTNTRRTIDIEQAAEHAAKEKIKLYIITIDPDLKDKNYELQTKLMDRSAAATGGHHYVATNPAELGHIYQEIQTLEKSTFIEHISAKNLQQDENIRSFSFYPLLTLIGLSMLFIGFLYETLWQRRVP